MEYYKYEVDATGEEFLRVKLNDYALIANPLLNKGMAFTYQERVDFGLVGLIPPNEATLTTQKIRSYSAYQSKVTDIEKYLYLRDLQDSNETLFYSLLEENIIELMPNVYTPTVGLGCQLFSHIYRRPRGVFISYLDQDRMDQILNHSRFDDVKVIVVSDGERILGLGDQGAGGMGIPIGKLALYTACAGIHPSATLPILLDVGTNNPELQNDPLYIGWRHERIRGTDYDNFIQRFVTAIKKRFPQALLQWEDFAQQNATPLLQRYRDELCTFNDDIQGTAAVAAGTLMAAINKTGVALHQQRIVLVGAGSAGCGISNLLKQAMMEEGLSDADAREKFYLVDKNGLMTNGMVGLLDFQKPFAQDLPRIKNWQCDNFNNISLLETIHNVKPTLLIGVSGQPKIFTQAIIQEMAKHVERPIIFPLSNPTTRSEADPADLMAWTQGKAIIGTGSPFQPVMRDGELFRVDQTNNSYIFPGLGLGLISVQAKLVTDSMFMVAAKALANCSPAKLDPRANLLPSLTEIRHVSLKVAHAVATEAIKSGHAQFIPPGDLETYIAKLMWTPKYLPYKPW